MFMEISLKLALTGKRVMGKWCQYVNYYRCQSLPHEILQNILDSCGFSLAIYCNGRVGWPSLEPSSHCSTLLCQVAMSVIMIWSKLLWYMFHHWLSNKVVFKLYLTVSFFKLSGMLCLQDWITYNSVLV